MSATATIGNFVREAGTLSLLLLGMGGAAASGAGASSRQPPPNYELVNWEVACLLTQSWVRDDVTTLGLKLHDYATVRYAKGDIPGTSPASGDIEQIVIYSRDRRHGWIFFVRVSNGRSLAAVRNAYRLRRDGQQWAASEGNGGIATYEAIGAYVTNLETQTPVKLRLVPASKPCAREE